MDSLPIFPEFEYSILIRYRGDPVCVDMLGKDDLTSTEFADKIETPWEPEECFNRWDAERRNTGVVQIDVWLRSCWNGSVVMVLNPTKHPSYIALELSRLFYPCRLKAYPYSVYTQKRGSIYSQCKFRMLLPRTRRICNFHVGDRFDQSDTHYR